MNLSLSHFSKSSKQTIIFIVAFLLGASLFIAIAVHSATVVGSAITGIGTTTPLWGDLTVEQQGGQGRLKGVFVVGDTGTSSPFIFVSQKGVVSMGSSTPSPLLLFPGDLVASSTYVAALGVNNATSTRGDFAVGNDFYVYNNGRVGIGTAAPSRLFHLSSTGPTIHLQESDASADNGRWECYAQGEQFRCDLADDALSAATQWITVDRTGTTLDNIAFGTNRLVMTNSGNLGIGTTSPWGLLSVDQAAATGRLKPLFVVGDNGTTTPFMFVNQKGVVGVGTSSTGSLSERAFAASTTEAIIGSASATTTLILDTGASVGACIEMKQVDGGYSRIFVNKAGTALVVEDGRCAN